MLSGVDFIETQAKAWTTMREKWAGNESVNGPGSTLALTENLRQELPRIFRDYNIKTMLDLPCGDWAWMKTVPLDSVDYLGWDVEPTLIEQNKELERPGIRFEEVNALTVHDFPKVDLILCKDFLYHLPTKWVLVVLLKAILSGSRYLLATHNPGADNTLRAGMDKGMQGVDGYFVQGLDLTKDPFGLQYPLEAIIEDADGADYVDGGVERVGMTNHTNTLFDLHGGYEEFGPGSWTVGLEQFGLDGTVFKRP